VLPPLFYKDLGLQNCFAIEPAGYAIGAGQPLEDALDGTGEKAFDGNGMGIDNLAQLR
jgi:hypothetical protein